MIVDTAKYHYLAWRSLARRLGFEFTEADNERLKGVSRMESLRILLEIGGLEATEEEREEMAASKNREYVDYISRLEPSEILPGAEAYLRQLRSQGVKIALGSASKNAGLILSRLGIADLFDAVIDGTKVSKAKPDPKCSWPPAWRWGSRRPNASCSRTRQRACRRAKPPAAALSASAARRSSPPPI
ncbi:hypothetical protein HMSSN036_95170 [Paenibacillus macerans]|nr:hypothetical protein HMSSN036_95170 [Paenibacillus macerans]